MAKPHLMLIDAHSVIHRAYHALPDFSNSKGEPTGALYGLVSMLISAISDIKPDYIVAAYDMPQKTHRHEIFEDYKAGRKKTDQELIWQLKKSKELLNSMAIQICQAPGFEADDIIGTLVQKKKKNFNITIMSGDLDMLQLVENKKVRVFTAKRSIKDTIIYDEDAIKNRYGFGPEFIVDFKALKGDPSDNISGVKGIGDKTATELIQKIGHLEDIYKTLDNDKEKITILGFKERIIRLLDEGKEDAFFSKTLVSIRFDAPCDMQFSEKWKKSLDLDKLGKIFSDLEFRTLLPRLKKLISQESLVKKEKTENVDISSIEFKELALALWLVRSDITNPDLEDIYSFSGVRNFNEARKIIFKTLHDRKLDIVYEKIEKPIIPVIDRMNRTGIRLDVKYLNKLSKTYHLELEKLKQKIWNLAKKEFNINSPKQLAEVLFNSLKIKPASSKRTTSGLPSTQEQELVKLKTQHPIVEIILQYRELQKLLSTYIDNLPKMISDGGRLHTHFIQSGTTTGRLSSQNPNLQNIPIKTKLGRNVRKGFVSDKNYSLVSFDYSQIELKVAAILSRDEKMIKIFKNGKDVHSAVASEIFDVPEKDVTYEMRRQAKVINFGILYGMGVNALRQNLGDNTSIKEAKDFLKKYFNKYLGLAKWIDKTKAEAARKGYTETLFGRRRYFDGINSEMQYMRAAAERMAINAPIQGTQADIIKLAMQKVDKLIKKKYNLDSVRLVLQIHDELIYEIKDNIIDTSIKDIKKTMEEILDAKTANGVPITVDVSHGKNWGEL